ncbi:Coenzyme Q-binding protein coq10, mitochondrial [Teratosphaeriaceae sp. CCFEE 6253]|nr:Coenzyme Q-binding protein coq10, mitochondrial [Teratosphaeriaceae sp. CCFEE 6253]
MTDYLSAAWGPPAPRESTHHATVPYHATTAFRAITDIGAYPGFLSLVQATTVTSKTPAGLPKSARLKAGYPRLGLQEDWVCKVHCDAKTGTVTLAKDDDPKAADGVLAHWSVKWKISPSALPIGGSKTCTVALTVEVAFRSAFYDQAFALLPSVAEVMLARFEQRMAEVDALERKERVAKLKEKAKAESAKKDAARKPPPSSAKAPPKKLEVRASKPNATSGLPVSSGKKAPS